MGRLRGEKQGAESSMQSAGAKGGQGELSLSSRRRKGLGGGGKEAKRLFAGAMSAVVARSALAPLERIKLECVINGANGTVAAATHLLQTDGLLGLWRGNGLNVLRTAPYKALNFATFDLLHDLGVERAARAGRAGGISNKDRFLAGAGAGLVSTIVCFPMDVLRTRIMRHGGRELYGGLGGAVTTILRTEGVGGLYRGLVPALISMGPSGAVFYGVYDLLKHRHMVAHGEGEPVGAGRTMAYGALAGASAETAVYPLEVVRRRLQVDTARAERGALRKMGGTFREIVRREGVSGLYRGVVPSTVQVLPSAALGYFTYELVKGKLDAEGTRERRQKEEERVEGGELALGQEGGGETAL